MTLSVHSQSHPWHRTLPYPLLPSAPNTLNWYPARDQAPNNSRPSTNALEAGLVGSASNKITAGTVPPVSYHWLNLPQRSLHEPEPTSTVSQPATSTDGAKHQMGPAVTTSSQARRSLSPSNSSTGDQPAFILYRQHQHASVVAKHPNLPNPDISKIIGEQWRALPDGIKEEWKTLADEEKARHSQQFPDYRYRPKRGGRYSLPTSTPTHSSSSFDSHTQCQKCGGKPVATPSTQPPPAPLSAPPTTSTDNAAKMHDQVWARNCRRHKTRLTNEKRRQLSLHQHQFPSSHPYSSSPIEGRSLHPNAPPLQTQFYSLNQAGPMNSNYRFPAHEHPEAKRRRLNDSNSNPATKPSHPDHSRSQHGENEVRAGPPHLHHQTTSTPQSRLPPANVLNSPFTTHHRDPNLTLPPLQTLATRPRTQSQRRSTLTRRQAMEAMIMSIPVLNKVKILSQISPSFAVAERSSTTEILGAVIAVEGMDAAAVFDMTNSLAEQLEKEGTFAVRIFKGPDPYVLLDGSAGSGSEHDGTSLNFSDCLSSIAQWHLISTEIKEYIKGSVGKETHEDSASRRVDVNMSGTDEHATTSQPLSGGPQDPRVQKAASQASTRSPISAVSPKTKPADLPESVDHIKTQAAPEVATINVKAVEAPRPRSRIPAAALLQQPKSIAADTQPSAPKPNDQDKPQSEQRLSTSKPDVSTTTTAQPGEAPKSDTTTATQPAQVTGTTEKTSQPQTRTKSLDAIPIAIIPHYQLTTVNASAINMPIKDTYSPHSHWQWLATLWRGCVGPDITVVVKSSIDDGDLSADGSQSAHPGSANSFPTPTTPASAHPYAHAVKHHLQNITQAQPPRQQSHTMTGNINSTVSKTATGVEIRLTDCKTIIVKTGSSSFAQAQTGDQRSNTSNNNTLTSTPSSGSSSIINSTNLEAWEKAKRRVGFEVDEYLRK